ncbi:MAG: ATP-binding protein, partial [Bacillota bacterium]
MRGYHWATLPQDQGVDPLRYADLLGIEAAARRERYLKTRTRLAHLPYHRTLEQFDFGFQPSV